MMQSNGPINENARYGLPSRNGGERVGLHLAH